MNEKSIIPLNSFSAYTPPFRYSALIDLHFSSLCKKRLVAGLNSTVHPGFKSHSLEQNVPEMPKSNKKSVPQKEFVFGAERDEPPHGKTTVVQKFRHRKGLSLIENIGKLQGDVPELVISTSPTKYIKRFISPYVREGRESPRSLKEARKNVLSKKTSVNLPMLYEDDSAKLKEFVFDYFLKTLRSTNGIQMRVNELKTYKFFVGAGNNSDLVVKIIRTRPWWTKVDSTREAHFIWTSVKHKKTINRLPPGNDLLMATTQLPKKPPLKKMQEMERQGFNLIFKSSSFVSLSNPNPLDMSLIKVHNRLNLNKHLVSKKRLFMNLKKFYISKGRPPFEVIPLTFHVKSGKTDEGFKEFQQSFHEILKSSGQKLWIIKPGENTNRGKGIKVLNSLEDIQDKISNPREGRTFVIQKYLERPLLLFKRKFDIRCFGLLTIFNTNLQGYFFPEGYIRTSSKEFSLKSQNKFIHLTNDAIQKHSEEYGKFEPGNKLSYSEFQNFLNQEHASSKVNFEKDINSQIRSIIIDTFQVAAPLVDPARKLHSFELLGYDFMVDEQFHVWLIEVNTNPCLELSCSHLSRLIPSVLDNTFRLTLDQLFCPSPDSKKFQKWIPEGLISNKFELVFSERVIDCNN
jgi:hypothetical protein